MQSIWLLNQQKNMQRRLGNRQKLEKSITDQIDSKIKDLKSPTLDKVRDALSPILSKQQIGSKNIVDARKFMLEHLQTKVLPNSKPGTKAVLSLIMREYNFLNNQSELITI